MIYYNWKNRIKLSLIPLIIIMGVLLGCGQNDTTDAATDVDSVNNDEAIITVIHEEDTEKAEVTDTTGDSIDNIVIYNEENMSVYEDVAATNNAELYGNAEASEGKVAPDSAADSGNAESDTQSSINPHGSSMQVHFVDVGQGDCSLIVCDGEAMLIDAGDNSKGTYVQKYLMKQGVSELKYVVGTHPDADHIGGLDVIIYKYACDNILMPDATSDTATYSDVISAINSKRYKITTVGEGDQFTLGSATVEILSPVKGYPYAENNNNSIVMRIDHFNNSFLFMADAEYQPQQVIYYDDEINAKADVVKVSHHGANSGYMKAFYDEVDPEYAVISVGKGNDYGHPHEDVLNDFKSRGVQVFRTDEQGSIVAKSDGTSIVFNTEPSVTWVTGDVYSAGQNNTGTTGTADSGATANGAFPQNISEKPADDVTYVLNLNSMKFHYPTCDSVTDMKQKNRKDVTCTREELLKQYPDAVPCKRCKP